MEGDGGWHQAGGLRPVQTRDLWWKNAVVYALDVETYADADGDGVGDFKGLTERLDYLVSLGVSCLWLLPFFPTPNKDDGYDVADFYGVDRRLGSFGDFVDFMQAARQRGLHVIVDLVFNHTSDQHPWFLAARSSRSDPHHDWYVWADTPIENATREMFPGDQEGNWAWVPEVEQYYLHTFYPFQPDLNFENPKVRDEILKTMAFWLDLGVSGFRIDAAPFLVQTIATEQGRPQPHHEWLNELHEFLVHHIGGAVLLAEADLPPNELQGYFGGERGREMDMLYNFELNNGLVHALATNEAASISRRLESIPDPPPTCAWLNYLRVHDELDLERLSDDEREEVFERFAPDEDMRIWGRGLRRRIASMLEGDRRSLELAYSLLFSLPGTPLLLYGEEIGMGDDLGLPERYSVRTPMQWNGQRNAGFSAARKDRLVRPVKADGAFGFQRVNVADQVADAGSLFHWMQRLITVRRISREMGFGSWRVADPPGDDVLRLEYEWVERKLVILHNLSTSACQCPLDIDGPEPELLLSDPDSVVDVAEGKVVSLAPHGYVWLRSYADTIIDGEGPA